MISTLRGALVELVRPGEGRASGLMLWRVGRVALTTVIIWTNLIGACAVLAMALLVVPLPAVENAGEARLTSGIGAVFYVAVAVVFGATVGTRRLHVLREWLVEERPAGTREQRAVLRAPLSLFGLQLALWWSAAIIFGLWNATYSPGLGLRIGITVAIAGLITAACAYLLIERVLRSAAARALAEGMPKRLVTPGVATRALFAWALASGLPMVALVGVGILVLTGDETSRTELALFVVVLGGIAVVVGLLAVVLAARATADPLNSLRRALGRVERGERDVRVPVYDATQIGQLQLGFNRMVEGLAEREHLRETLGTYVDPEVARHLLEEGTSLEGEEVEVTAMFVDVRNFTDFAEGTQAPEVVAALNGLFERLVPVIHAHDGHVDKFIGDGLLAVFGAPRRQHDHADRGLEAALEIERGLEGGEQAAGLEIGIGLNSGPVVAGNVGGGGRLEFSVIGDAVNIAARVEAATRQTGDLVLITEETRRRLSRVEAELVERPDVALKGKSETVRVFALASAGSARDGAAARA